jgi:signal transduction histidine kinase
LLSFSQVSFHPSVNEDVDLNQLIDVVLEDLDLEIEDKKADITVDGLFTIKGHHRQWQQAFQNLIGNAVKYSKPGTAPIVHISCNKVVGKNAGLQLSSAQQDQSFYCISVKDNGIGFEQEDAERIFNVFTRLHGNSEYKGTGIGLSIVRKVVENHNGYIMAESSPDQGATFKIYLPEIR